KLGREAFEEMQQLYGYGYDARAAGYLAHTSEFQVVTSEFIDGRGGPDFHAACVDEYGYYANNHQYLNLLYNNSYTFQTAVEKAAQGILMAHRHVLVDQYINAFIEHGGEPGESPDKKEERRELATTYREFY